MAQMEIDYDGFDRIEASLEGMGRNGVRRIVEAGATAAADEMRRAITEAHHVRTGDMLSSVRAGEYHETLGGGYMAVYPQGEDRHGISNTVKAFVINYGRGRRKKGSRMGDRFITDKEDKTEAIVLAAMQAEAENLMNG